MIMLDCAGQLSWKSRPYDTDLSLTCTWRLEYRTVIMLHLSAELSATVKVGVRDKFRIVS
jgi:hypothetical protein